MSTQLVSRHTHLLACFFVVILHCGTTEAALNCPPASPDQLKNSCGKASVCFEGQGCDAKSGMFRMEQCMNAAMCAACYPDSPCKNAKTWVGAKVQLSAAPAACMESVTAPARAMALQFESFNGAQNSKLHNISQCGFQELQLLTDTNPITLVIMFKAKDDSDVVKLLRKAAKSVGGGVVLRNRVVVSTIPMNFVTFLGFPSPAALVKMLGSIEFAAAVSGMKAEWSSISMSVTRMNIDVRVPATDCAHKPWNFDAALALPWPEMQVREETNKMMLLGDKGGAMQNLIFNKALSVQAASQATFDYAVTVAEATLKHGFSPHVAFTCNPTASGSTQRSPVFCRSVQLVGDTLMGYDTVRVVEYPSRRAMMSMINDESWKIENKADEWESNTGVPSEPIVDATITDIPQLVTPSFKALTGFEQTPTACSDAVRQGQTRSDILNHTCFAKSARGNIGSLGDPCISVFEINASAACPAACQALVDELRPCLGGMWNTYSGSDALLLARMKSGQIPAKDVASSLTSRGWYMEVERRGCKASVVTDPTAPASASSRLAQLNVICVVISTVIQMMQ